VRNDKCVFDVLKHINALQNTDRLIDWLFVDRAEKEKQNIVIEIEAVSSQLDTANKARVSGFS